MAGGGHIIIRRSLRKVLELEVVQQELPPTKKQKLLTLLTKKDADWNKQDDCFAVECIQRGLDAED